MNEPVFLLTIAAAAAFTVYWYIRFKHILPLDRKALALKKELDNFSAFSNEILNQFYVPESAEHYADITNHHIIKMHKIFPESFILVLDASDEGWRLADYADSLKTGPKLLSHYQSGLLDKYSAQEQLQRVTVTQSDREDGLGVLLRSFGTVSALVAPYMPSEGRARRFLIFSEPRLGPFQDSGEAVFSRDEQVHAGEQYLRFMTAQLNVLHRVLEKTGGEKKENEQLKNELNAVLKELDMAGSRLIRGAKERKALYEVVTKLTGEERDVRTGVSAILNVIAKMLDADVAACMLFDETRNVLAISPGSFGITEKERQQYTLSVSNTDSALARTFVNKTSFITPDAQNDPAVIGYYARQWNIRSLMIVPISLRNRVIGVLPVGSRHGDFFTQEHLDFLALIADELAVIVEMVTLYENLSKTAQELAQLNRLKDEFLSTVSHELKTPLTTIKGFVSVILSGESGSLNEQQISFLSIVDQAVNRLTHLISNLLDLSRLSGAVEMEFAAVDLREVLNSAVSNMYMKAKEHKISISVTVDQNLPLVQADLRWITQVIDNLILNAIKYAGTGAEITVRGLNKGDAAVVAVEDTGPGIPDEEQALIFDKFYRGKISAAQVPGTGLGLAISKSVVEKHGGKIWVESKIGEGAKFLFAIPAGKQHIRSPLAANGAEHE